MSPYPDDTLTALYLRYATEDRIAAAEYGGRAAGAMLALRYLYLDREATRQPISEDLAAFWAKMAANCAHSAQTWEAHLRETGRLGGDLGSAILAQGFSESAGGEL
jgi:hypothetical protein